MGHATGAIGLTNTKVYLSTAAKVDGSGSKNAYTYANVETLKGASDANYIEPSAIGALSKSTSTTSVSLAGGGSISVAGGSTRDDWELTIPFRPNNAQELAISQLADGAVIQVVVEGDTGKTAKTAFVIDGQATISITPAQGSDVMSIVVAIAVADVSPPIAQA